MEVKKIYFDMDGVLADFDRGIVELCNLPVIQQDKRSEEENKIMWNKVREVGNFYYKLKPIDGSIEMFNLIYSKYKNKCEILSGIPKKDKNIETASIDKINWIKKYLNKDIKINLVYKKDKKNYCLGNGYILIDDLKSSIDIWNSLGGIGILHKSNEDTINILKNNKIL